MHDIPKLYSGEKGEIGSLDVLVLGRRREYGRSVRSRVADGWFRLAMIHVGSDDGCHVCNVQTHHGAGFDNCKVPVVQHHNEHDYGEGKEEGVAEKGEFWDVKWPYESD